MKKKKRIRRALSYRVKIKKINKHRLVIHRTSKHIYAQIISFYNNNILLSASTLEKKLINKLNYTGNKKSAFLIGKIIAKRAIKNGINNIIFDRSGFKYHGRIKALADAARQNGLKF